MSSDEDPVVQHDARRQLAAESDDARGGAVVDRYRYVAWAVAHAALPPVPADLADRLEALVADQPEQARFERWTLAAALFAAAAVLVAFGIPIASAAARLSLPMLGNLPWGFLLTAAAGLAVAAVLDGILVRHGRSASHAG